MTDQESDQSEENKQAVEAAIEALASWNDELRDAVLEYTFDPDKPVEEVGELFVALDNVIKELSLTKGFLQGCLDKLMSVYDILAIKDAGVMVEKTQGKNRVKWDHNTVRSAVTEKILEEFVTEDGTIDAPLSVVVNRAFDFTGLKWKVTQLREAELDPNQYSEESDGKIGYSIKPIEQPKENDSNDRIEDDPF